MFRPANFITRNALAAAGRALPRRRSRRMANSISSANRAMCSCFLPARSSVCWRRTGLRAFAWPHLLFPTARCTSAPRRTCWRSGPGSEFAGIESRINGESEGDQQMNRRTFLATMSSLAALEAAPVLAGGNAKGRSTSNSPPRKVIVGTAMQSFWGQYPGLHNRLDQLAGIVDQMAAQAKKEYGRGLDLAVLPETGITGEAEGDALARSVPFQGQVQDLFTRKAREHECYIVVPTYLLDSREKKLCSNAAILVGRKGETVGTYRKIHLVVSLERGTMEGGATPGDALPVFDCDFGKLGIQICYDMEFADGWTELARQGAELIAWPTQSPQTSQPAFRARE